MLGSVLLESLNIFLGKCSALVKDTSNSNNTLKCVQSMFEK
jgi:hypothetical protein